MSRFSFRLFFLVALCVFVQKSILAQPSYEFLRNVPIHGGELKLLPESTHSSCFLVDANSLIRVPFESTLGDNAKPDANIKFAEDVDTKLVAISRDGEHVVAADSQHDENGQWLRLYDFGPPIPDAETVAKKNFLVRGVYITSLAFSADARFIIVTTSRSHLMFFEKDGGINPVYDFVLSPESVDTQTDAISYMATMILRPKSDAELLIRYYDVDSGEVFEQVRLEYSVNPDTGDCSLKTLNVYLGTDPMRYSSDGHYLFSKHAKQKINLDETSATSYGFSYDAFSGQLYPLNTTGLQKPDDRTLEFTQNSFQSRKCPQILAATLSPNQEYFAFQYSDGNVIIRQRLGSSTKSAFKR